MTLLGTTLALSFCVVLTVLAVREYRYRRELFTPWLVILVFAVIDVFLPAALFMTFGTPTLPPWMAPIRPESILSAMLIYLASIAFFAAGYFFVAGSERETRRGKNWLRLALIEIRPHRVYLALLGTGSWYLVSLATLAQQAGGLEAYLSQSFARRFRGEALVSENLTQLVLLQLAPAMRLSFLSLVGLLFFARYRYKRPILWGVFLPVIGWLFTLTTFFRGSQLVYFLSLAFLEATRGRLGKAYPWSGLQRELVPAASTSTRRVVPRGAVVLIILSTTFFGLYGAYRAYNTWSEWGKPISVSTAVASQTTEVLRGSSLLSLASILDFYPENGEFLKGRTLVDTLLLPVPRALWPEKPAWYGIDDVTRRMGWPTTTQSAVTIPGEFYANFGPLGIVGIAGFGVTFGLLYRYRHRPNLFFVYAFGVLHAVLLTQWMASTGLMTSLIVLPPALVVHCLVLARPRRVEPPPVRAPTVSPVPASV